MAVLIYLLALAALIAVPILFKNRVRWWWLCILAAAAVLGSELGATVYLVLGAVLTAGALRFIRLRIWMAALAIAVIIVTVGYFWHDHQNRVNDPNGAYNRGVYLIDASDPFNYHHKTSSFGWWLFNWGILSGDDVTYGQAGLAHMGVSLDGAAAWDFFKVAPIHLLCWLVFLSVVNPAARSVKCKQEPGVQPPTVT